MTVEIEVVEAIAEDINANAGLPEHQTITKRRPLAILPDDCPLLCVWLQAAEPRRTTTDRFDSVLSVGISWHEATVEQAETLVEDDDLTASMLVALAAIKTRVRHLSVNGLGTENAWECLPGAVRFLPPEMQQGLTEGYAHEVIVQVSEV